MKEYCIRFSRLPELQEKLVKLNRRASKLGMVPIIMNVGQPYFRPDSTDDDKGFQAVTVSLEGNAPVINGWTFAGILDFTDGGILVKGILGSVIPEKFRHTGSFCEHCRTNRKRNSVIVLCNGEDWKQVGTDCASDYLRSDDASEALRIMTMLDSLEYDLASDESGESGFGMKGDGFNTLSFLAKVCQIIEGKGWTPKSRADMDHPATVDIVIKYLATIMPSESNTVEAQEAIQWGQNLDAKTDYEHNVQVVCQSSYCSLRNTGILASVIAAYRAFKNRAKETVKSVHIGTVGDKVDWTLVLRSRYVADGMYGATTILSFLDPDGNAIVWKASGVKLSEGDRGKAYRVKGRVKAHSEYKGMAQTCLTRCILTEV